MSSNIGVFVTIEGPNGVGKTSIVSGVADRLRQAGFDVLETSEPTSSALGQLVRQSEANYHGKVYACLIAADRYFHLDAEIIPALQQGKIVLSSRYIESSLVLQRLDDLPIDFIWALNSQVQIPHLSIILTAPAELLVQRLAQRNSFSRFELTKTRASELNLYRDAAEFLSRQGFNILVLDNGHTPIEENIHQISEEITKLATRQ